MASDNNAATQSLGTSDSAAEYYAAPPDETTQNGETVVVCGLGRFGLRLVELLRAQEIPVVALSGDRTRPDRVRRAEAVGARVVVGDFTLPEARARAGVEESRAVLLAASEDTANLETALDIRRDAPHVRIVMRLDSDNADRLGPRLEVDFGIAAVLSPPLLAAPTFAAAALQGAAPSDETEADAAPRIGSASPNSVDVASRHSRLRRKPVAPALSVIALFLLIIFFFAVAVFERHLGMSWIDAVYFTATIITTTGFGDYNLRDAESGLKLFGAGLMFSGVVLIALLSSSLTNFFASGAVERLRSERRAGRMRGHVIVCGLGGVGVEVAQALHAGGFRRVVAVDRDEERSRDGRGLPRQTPLIVGDATLPDTLLRAGLLRARALIAVASSDATNLEIALIAQTLVSETRRGQTGGRPRASFCAVSTRTWPAASTPFLARTSCCRRRRSRPRFSSAPPWGRRPNRWVE